MPIGNKKIYILLDISSYMKRFIILFMLPLMLYATAQETSYYLHDDVHPTHENLKLMDTSQPTERYSSYFNLDESPAVWATPPFDKEGKISGDVRVILWIEAFFVKPEILPFQFRLIKVSLVDITPIGSIDVIDSTRPTPMLFFGNDTLKQYTFKLDNIEYVIPSGHSLGIKVEKVVDFLSYFPLSILSPFFATNVLYDSTYTKSYALIPFNITGGIDLKCFENEKKVKPGKEVSYGLIVYNNAPQKDIIELYTDYKGKWSVKIEPDKIVVEANSFNYSNVKIKAPENASEGEYLNITIYAKGSSGSDSIWLNTTVIPYEYGVKVTAKDAEKEGEPAEKLSFIFNVMNTGDLPDEYSLEVDCKWQWEIEENKISLKAKENKDVKVYVTIPENASNGTIQEIKLTAKSLNSDAQASATAKLKVYYVITPSPPEGLGKKIGYVLFVLGVVALLVMATYLGKMAKKSVILSCEERLVEVAPGGKALFKVKIKNPLEIRKEKMRYKISIEGKIPENWIANVSREEIYLAKEEETTVEVEIKVPEDALLEEWASIDFVVIPEKGKSEKMNLIVTVREPMSILKMDVKHEPEEFKEGEKVITKVKIENEGEKDAENKKVILILNGKEKNRIEGINIPAKTTVEIDIPWIAEEENEVEVKLE